MLTEDYEGVNEGNLPKKFFFCVKCLTELVEVRKNESKCQHCGKSGYEMLYRCPECGISKKSFQQDFNSIPLCYCET